MQQMLRHRVRLTLNDSRCVSGQLLAFDVHLNLVLADAEETRLVKRKRSSRTRDAAKEEEEDEYAAPAQERRTLGLTVVRGEYIVSTTIEGPPPTDPRDRLAKAQPGPGSGRAIGRGAPITSAATPLGANPLGGPISRGGTLGRGFAPAALR